MRFLNPSSSETAPSDRRRRRDGRGEEPQLIREGCLVENNEGDTLRYWTISGRNLVTGVNATDGRSSASSATLLMDAETIHDENGEAEQQSMQGEKGEGEA